MKRVISLLLILMMTLSPCVNAYADSNEKHLASSEVKDNMLSYIKDGNSKLLLTSNNYCHMSFIKQFNSNAWDLYLIQMTDFLIDTGYKPDEMKYTETLVNIIATYELDNASDMAEQCKMDNLKTFKDYAMDMAKMGANAVDIVSGNSASSSALEEGIAIAVSGVSCLMENTENWIEAISNLEVIVQNYSKYDAFLAVIEEKADGDLKKAAGTLRKSLENAMLLKLETYIDVKDANFENYTEFFFEDVFFTALKQTPDYVKDDAFQFFVDAGDKISTARTPLDASWGFGKQVGTLIGNLAVGGEDLITRVLEMMAIHDISVILQDKVYELEMEFLNDYEEAQQAVVDSYILYSQYLIGSRIRGEYCLYSVIANDAGLLSWANKDSAEEAKETYENTVDVLLRIQKELLGIKDQKQVALDDYMDNFELMVKEVGGQFSEETGHHQNWVIKDQDLQYGNYFNSNRVDEVTLISDLYSIYGTYIGQDLERAKEILLDSSWNISENRSDIEVVVFQKNEINMQVHYQENVLTSISFWRTDETIMSTENNGVSDSVNSSLSDVNYLLGTWYTEGYDKEEAWAVSYKTQFYDDGTVVNEGYRNKDVGTYKLLDDGTVIATYNENYISMAGRSSQLLEYTYTVTYKYNSKNNTLSTEYDDTFINECQSNADSGVLYR